MGAGLDNPTSERTDKNVPAAALEPEFDSTAKGTPSDPPANDKDDDRKIESGKKGGDSVGGSDDAKLNYTHVFDGQKSDVLALNKAYNVDSAEKTVKTEFDRNNKFEIVDKSADKNAGDTAAKAGDKSVSPAEKAAAWLSNWFFAEKHGGKPGDREPIHSINKKTGRPSTTTIGESTADGPPGDSIHNETRDPKTDKVIADTTITKSKIIDVNEHGDTATFDRISKTLEEKGIKGATVTYDQGEGKYTIQEGPRPDGSQGRTAEINAQGDVVYTNRKGERKTISKDVIDHGDRHGFNIRQSRHKDNGAQEQDCGKQERECSEQRGSKEVTSVTDVKTGQQMIVVNDGQGTVMKLHQGGSKEIIHTPETGKEIHLKVKPGSESINARIGDKDHVIDRNNSTGEWEIKDSNGNPSGRIKDNQLVLNDENGQPGQVIGTIDGNNLKIGTSTISGDGTFRAHGDRGRVRLDRERRQAVVEDNEGTASSVIRLDDTKSAVADLNADPLRAPQAEVTEVDTSNQKVKITAVPTDGSDGSNIPPILELDGALQEKGGNFQFNTNDGSVNLNRTDRGIEANLWNGDKITDQGALERKNGVIIDKDGTTHLADGKKVDPHGVIFDSEEEYDSSSDEDCDNASEAAVIQQIANFSAIAAAISNNPNPTAGDLAYLSSLSSAIGAAVAGDSDGCFAGAAAAAQSSLRTAMAVIENAINSSVRTV